jgi:hypothetical protein
MYSATKLRNYARACLKFVKMFFIRLFVPYLVTFFAHKALYSLQKVRSLAKKHIITFQINKMHMSSKCNLK